MKIFRAAFSGIVGAVTIHLATYYNTPRWPTLIVGLVILVIGWWLIDRKSG